MYNFFCIFFFRTILLPVRHKMMNRKTAYKWQIISYLISENHCSFVQNQTWGICENVSYIQRWILYLVMEKWHTYLDSKGNWNFYIFCFHSFDKKICLNDFFAFWTKFLNTVSGSEQVVVWIIQALKNDTY